MGVRRTHAVSQGHEWGQSVCACVWVTGAGGNALLGCCALFGQAGAWKRRFLRPAIIPTVCQTCHPPSADKGAVESYGACTRAVDHFAFEWLSSCKGLAARLGTSFSAERTPTLLFPGGTSRMSVWAFLNTAYGRERIAGKLAKCAGMTPPAPKVDTTGLGDAIKAIRKYVLSNKYAKVLKADSDAMADLVSGKNHDDATNWSTVVEAAAPSCTFKCSAPNKCRPIKKPADTTGTVRRSDQACGVTA